MIMNNKKKVALVAHDNMKRDLAEWVDWNWEVLLKHHLICTGTTGKMVEKTLMGSSRPRVSGGRRGHYAAQVGSARR